jgi:2-keto-4-pentenoate hydratase/2-oxohepta-3-ene-1,7-dioic acid hydratase in catechol pathway
MRLVTFRHPRAGEHVGIIVGEQVLDLTASSGGDPEFASMLALARGGPAVLAKAAKLERTAEERAAGDGLALYPASEVTMLAPIPRPSKNVYCVGLNFRSHVEQNAAALGLPADIPTIPLFFSKPVTAVIGPGEGIINDSRLTEQLDYEVELAVVLGAGGTWIPAEQAHEHILGYTLLNDVSARDLQWRTSQFLYGKGLDTYCPVGPAIVTPDELGPLDSVVLELLVNGESRQSEPAGNMLFPPEVAIAELSKGITLEPGDMISMGTPGGCGYQMQPPRFLAVGDVVECRATGIGQLTNPVVAPGAPA